jgi:hypothetical protein
VRGNEDASRSRDRDAEHFRFQRLHFRKIVYLSLQLV